MYVKLLSGFLGHSASYGFAHLPSSAPALYEKYANNPVPPVDEWALSLAMRADTTGGGINQLEEHYKTFIVSIFSRSLHQT